MIRVFRQYSIFVKGITRRRILSINRYPFPFAAKEQRPALTPSYTFSPLVSDSHSIDVPQPHSVNSLEKNPVPYSFGVELGDKRLNKRYITMVRSIMNALRIWNLQSLIVHVIACEADSFVAFCFPVYLYCYGFLISLNHAIMTSTRSN
ncbi:MAG: hypothetical protein LBC20_08885 [Planctomycetaceae bacterium]|jgi:hypothetical protein|nr:hypothetical protein [Planctomycetaceae bacterium]